MLLTILINLIELKAAFDEFDVDKSETISSSELKNVLKKLDVTATDADCEEMMTLLDRNKDGVIKFSGNVLIFFRKLKIN